MNILVLAPNWLGDAAMATPALRALKKQYPQATLTVTAPPAVCALLEELPWIDRLHPLASQAGLSVMRREARLLKEAGRDLIVVLPHSFRAALFARLIGGKKRLGYARNGRSFLLSRAVAPYREEGCITPVYMAKEYLDLVAEVGASDDGLGLELGVPEAVLKQVRLELSGEGPLIAIAPGAAFGPAKQWMPEAFAKTADLLAEQRGTRCVLITGPGEEKLADEIQSKAEFPLLPMPCKEAGLASLKAVIASVDLLLCNDSGPRHIAVAFDTTVLCIMGPTSPRYTDSPYEKGRIIREPLPCSPCQKPICPLGHHLCMRLIRPEKISQIALELLS